MAEFPSVPMLQSAPQRMHVALDSELPQATNTTKTTFNDVQSGKTKPISQWTSVALVYLSNKTALKVPKTNKNLFVFS